LPSRFWSSRTLAGNAKYLLADLQKTSGTQYVRKRTRRSVPEDVRGTRFGIGDVHELTKNRRGKKEWLLRRSPDDENGLAAGLQNAQTFVHGARRIDKKHRAETAGQAVELRIRKGKRLHIGLAGAHV